MASGGQIARNDEQECSILSPERICLNLQKQAHMLELSYSSVAKCPEVAGKIREAAIAARSQQMLAYGVVKGIRLTSNHICKEMIPMVLEGILEKDQSLISEAITLTITLIKETEQKTTNLSTRYGQLFKTLGNVVEVVKTTNKRRAEQEGKLKIKMKLENEQALKLQSALKRVDAERERMIKEIENEKQKRQELYQQTETKGKNETLSVSVLAFLGTCIGGACLCAPFAVPVIAGVAPIFGAAAAAASAACTPLVVTGSALVLGSNVVSAVGIRRANSSTIDKMTEVLLKSEISQGLPAINTRKEQLETELYTHERHANKYDMKLDVLRDSESLAQAIECTVLLNDQFEVLTMFWVDLIAAFGQLEMEFKTGSLFRSLKNESYVLKLRDICNTAAKKWESMSSVCGKVEMAINEDIGVNYAFLSKNYDALTDEDRKKRTDELQASIHDIENKSGSNRKEM